MGPVATFHIRAAALDDMPDLAGIFRRSSLFNEGDRAKLLAHPEALELTDIAVREGRTRVAVLEGGDVVGFATTRLVDGDLDLEDLFVDPSWMRRGAGRALVSDALAAAAVAGFDRMVVTANPHARGFYEALGFEVDGATATPFGPGLRMHVAVGR